MPADAWITLAVLGTILLAIATERVQPVFALAGGVLVLLLTGVLTDTQALSGFGHAAPATVAALYVIAGAATATGALGGLTDKLVGGGRSRRLEVARFTGFTAGLSAFVPNTPLVALLAPRVVAWCRRAGRSPSSFLMPLSYAALLGGVITLLGTSTNLVVNDLLADTGLRRLDIFEITPVGLAVAAAGVVGMVVLSPLLLRQHEPTVDAMLGTARRFTVAMRVDPNGALSNTAILDAGLHDLPGVELVVAERDGRFLDAIPTLLLVGDDILFFTGDVSRVVDLHATRGLVAVEHDQSVDTVNLRDSALFEAVVSERSDLVGRSMSVVEFRDRYDAVVLAIHRGDHAVMGTMGNVVLRRGDVLLLHAASRFAHIWRDRSDFSVIAALDESPPPRTAKAWLVSVAFASVILLSAIRALTLLQASLAAAAGLLVIRVITPGEARRSVNLNVVITIALSISLGTAVAISGLADKMAEVLGDLGAPFGDVGRLGAVLIATMIMTELLANNGAAAVMFPVGVATALHAGLDPRTFAVAVLIGASCSFLAPIGDQTKLMVHGLGGYRFSDFARLGAPLTLITSVVTLVVLPIAMPLR